jgi:hypothetical protein
MRNVVWVCLLLGLGGAGGVLPQVAIAQSASPVVAQQRPTKPTSTFSGPPLEVKLLNPGTGDRQVLRFKPAVGTRQLSVMSFEQAMVLSMLGKSLPSPDLPLINTTIEVIVTKVEENGDIHYQFSYPSMEVVPKPGTPSTLVEPIRAQLKQLKNIRGNFVMNNRGQLQAGNFELPKDLEPVVRQLFEQFSQSINQLSFPLPEEAVGIGATWQTTATLAINGMRLTQTGTYELVSRNNNIATLNIQVKQQAPPQVINSPTLPATTKVQLKKLETQGRGRSTLDLSKPFVQQSTLSMQSTSQTSTRTPESAQEFDMTIQSTVQMKFQPK